MKRQCNHCGLRIDSVELVQENRTWCPIYNKEVENKQPDCEHWKPDETSISSNKIQIADEIKRTIRSQSDRNDETVVSKTDIKTFARRLSTLWVKGSLKSKISIIIGTVLFVATVVGTILGVISFASNHSSNRSYRFEVLQELQNGRDSLAYTLVCRNRDWRRPPNFNLIHAEKGSKLFDNNQALRRDVRNLYEAMSSAMKHAEELRNLLAQKNADPKSIQNLEAAIEKTVELADRIGPNIALPLGQKWKTPRPNMSVEQLTEYYEGNIGYSVATDDMVRFGK